jgi:serine/threonine protein phosphatase PrpC
MIVSPLEYSATTHPGLLRDNNEDTYLCLPEAGLWLVADGMGGHEAGEVASAIVRDTVAQKIKTNPNSELGLSIQTAHKAILDSAAIGIGAIGMGSTVVALKSRDKHFQIAWVGDSRAYLWTPDHNGGQLERLSVDHSYVQMLVDKGAISPEEAEIHPEKNIITQCLGMPELDQVSVDLVQGQWQKGQWILLCSDGLTDEMNDQAIAQILSECDNSLTAVDQLLHAALTKGGHDNITLQIIESPVRTHPFWMALKQWVPHLTGNTYVDAGIFSATLALLVASILSFLF